MLEIARRILALAEQAEVDLEVADPEFKLADTHAALKELVESAAADIARLESGDIEE